MAIPMAWGMMIDNSTVLHSSDLHLLSTIGTYRNLVVVTLHTTPVRVVAEDSLLYHYRWGGILLKASKFGPIYAVSP